jgi:SAM-dependent methyltransferase
VTTASEIRLDPSITRLHYHPLRQLASALREEAGKLRESDLVVDVGCGGKPYAPLFSSRYLGVDRTSFHGDPNCLGVAEALPLIDGCADVALSTQSLEHADRPELLLEEAHRVLRPGGTLLLSTHGVWVHHPDPHDYWRWTEEGLRRLIESEGFEVVRVHRQCGVFLTGALLAAYPVGAATTDRRRVVRAVASVVVGALNILGFLLEAGAALLPRDYASISYLVVAQKPSASAARRPNRARGARA